MKITPVRSLKDYEGPKSHRAILFKIQEDAKKENNVELPLSYIEKVVTLFFSPTGIVHYFRLYKSFDIKGLGYWSLTNAGRKERRRLIKHRKRQKLLVNRRACRNYRRKLAKLKKREKRKALAASKRVSLK